MKELLFTICITYLYIAIDLNERAAVHYLHYLLLQIIARTPRNAHPWRFMSTAEPMLNHTGSTVYEWWYPPPLLYYPQPCTLLTCTKMVILNTQIANRSSVHRVWAMARDYFATTKKTEWLVTCRPVYTKCCAGNIPIRNFAEANWFLIKLSCPNILAVTSLTPEY